MTKTIILALLLFAYTLNDRLGLAYM